MILEGGRPKSQKDSGDALGQDSLRASADFIKEFYVLIHFGCAGSLLPHVGFRELQCMAFSSWWLPLWSTDFRVPGLL